MKVCEITGKVAIVGNNVSHSHPVSYTHLTLPTIA